MPARSGPVALVLLIGLSAQGAAAESARGWSAEGTQSATRAAAGDRVAFRLRVTNRGAPPARVTLDALLLGTSTESVQIVRSPPGATCTKGRSTSGNSAQVRCRTARLGPGASATVEVSAPFAGNLPGNRLAVQLVATTGATRIITRTLVVEAASRLPAVASTTTPTSPRARSDGGVGTKCRAELKLDPSAPGRPGKPGLSGVLTIDVVRAGQGTVDVRLAMTMTGAHGRVGSPAPIIHGLLVWRGLDGVPQRFEYPDQQSLGDTGTGAWDQDSTPDVIEAKETFFRLAPKTATFGDNIPWAIRVPVTAFDNDSGAAVPSDLVATVRAADCGLG